MSSFAVYEVETGVIVSTGFASTPEQAMRQARDGQAVLLADGLDDTVHYIHVDGDLREVRERPRLNVLDVTLGVGSEPVPVTPPLPAGTKVHVYGGPPWVVAGRLLHGPLEAGVTVYHLKPPAPYVPARLTVTVTA